MLNMMSWDGECIYLNKKTIQCFIVFFWFGKIDAKQVDQLDVDFPWLIGEKETNSDAITDMNTP